MCEIIWKPSRERIEQANVTRLMKRHGLKSYEELLAWCTEDIARFEQHIFALGFGVSSAEYKRAVRSGLGAG